MPDSDGSHSDGDRPSKRAQLKALRLQLKNELKTCKDKTQQKAVQAKYDQLEREIKGQVTGEAVPTAPAPVLDLTWTVTEREVSAKQQKRQDKRKAEEAALDAIREASKGTKLHNEREMAAIKGHIQLYKKQHGIHEHLEIAPIPSDGSCLFSAVAFHVKVGEISDSANSETLRSLAAARLRSHRDEYEAFVDGDFDAYVAAVASDAWGGEVELRALSDLLKRAIVVFRQEDFRVIGEDFFDKTTAIPVTFHNFQFACPHYNTLKKVALQGFSLVA